MNQFQDITTKRTKKKIAQAISRVRQAGLTAAAAELSAYTEKVKSQVRPKTLENYSNQLSKIIRDTGKEPDKFTNEDLRSFFNKISSMSNGTKHGAFQALRSYFCDYKKYNRIMNQDLTSKWETLTANIKRPTVSKRLMSDDDLIKPEELEMLIRAARYDRDKAFLSMLFETGARISELSSLEIMDIRLDSKPIKVYIQHSKTEDKEGRRVVYLIKSEPYLKRWLEQHPRNNNKAFYHSNVPLWLSLDKNERPPTIYGWAQMMKRCAQRAGIKKHLYHHLFRHSRAYDLHYNYGLGVKEVKELLGHSKLETTDGYLKINKDLMIQKLQGGANEVELIKEREEAIKAGKPVLCFCGEHNEPRRAFCHKCGRVINQDTAKELVSKKEEEKTAIETRLKRMEEMLRAITMSNANIDLLKKAAKMK